MDPPSYSSIDREILTAEERIAPIVARGKVNRDSLSGLMELMAELRSVLNESRLVGAEDQLDREAIIRQVVMANVPFMADRFYEKETKKRKKDSKFQYKFKDMIEAISDRAQVLKAQGKNVSKPVP